MKVAIYARISRLTEATTSVSRQITHCESLCQSRGWDDVDVYADEGVSGAAAMDARPQMQRLLQRLHTYHAIVFYRVDRLARSIVEFASLVDRCSAASTILVSVTEPIDLSTPVGVAIAQVIAVFAALERSMIKERSADARANLDATGRWAGGRLPYGLKAVRHPSGKGWVRARDHSKTKDLRRMALETIDGKSAPEVAKGLEQDGVATTQQRRKDVRHPDGTPAPVWWAETVRVILRHPQLVGYDVLPTSFGTDAAPTPDYDPALTVAEWIQLQAALDRRSTGPRDTRRKDSHWLQRHVECSGCRGSMTSTVSHGHRALRCGRPTVQRHPASALIRVESLASWVLDRLVHDWGHMQMLRRVWVGGVDHSAEHRAVVDTIRRMRDDREAGLYVGEADEEEYRTRMRVLVERRGILAALPDEPGHWDTEPTGATVADALRDDPASAGEVLDMIGLKVIVYPTQRRAVPVGDRAVIVSRNPAAMWEETAGEG